MVSTPLRSGPPPRNASCSLKPCAKIPRAKRQVSPRPHSLLRSAQTHNRKTGGNQAAHRLRLPPSLNRRAAKVVGFGPHTTDLLQNLEEQQQPHPQGAAARHCATHGDVGMIKRQHRKKRGAAPRPRAPLRACLPATAGAPVLNFAP